MTRRRRLGAVAVAGAVALLSAACTTARPATRPSSSPTPTPSATASVRPLGPGLQRAWLHGVGVDAPAGWKRDALRCGTPTEDTLVVTTVGAAHPDCDLRQPSGLSVVWLGDYQGGLRPGQVLGRFHLGSRGAAALHPRNIGPLTVLATSRTGFDGGTLDVLVLPHRHVYLLAWSPDADVLARTIESLQTTLVDPDTGCEVYSHRYDDVRRLPSQAGRKIVPGHPTGGEACYYVDGWLEAGVTMTATKTRALADAINRAPKAPVSHACQQVRQGDYTAPGPMALTFDYDSDPSRVVVARIFSCHGWSSYVSDGTVTHRLGRATLDHIPRLWGYAVPKGVH